jgi:hypothetical protein
LEIAVTGRICCHTVTLAVTHEAVVIEKAQAMPLNWKANTIEDARRNGATATAAEPPQTGRPIALGGTAPTAADTFDAAAFDALPLRDKLDRAAHASLAFKMALIASTDVATASDARIKAALSAAQSIVLTKARVDEVGLSRAPGPDRTAEHWARWEKLKRTTPLIAAPDGERAARASKPAITVIEAVAEKAK